MGMAERAKDLRAKEQKLLEDLIKKHEELIPTVSKTQVMVDLYWKCYAYGDELKPHIEVLDGIMLSSTRDIAPSCVENVDELIERQEKSLVQLETKRSVVKDLIDKGKKILENPDKPKFLESHVSRIELGWDDTKMKAQERLKLLQTPRRLGLAMLRTMTQSLLRLRRALRRSRRSRRGLPSRMPSPISLRGRIC